MSGSKNTPAQGSTAVAPTPTPSRAPDPLIGRVINERFRIISLLARGGMGKVYRAEQAALGRLVALKVLNPGYSSDADPGFQKRFFLEAATSSKLRHPNTVTIFDYGKTDDDVYYIAMELLEGRTLHRALQDEAPLSPQRVMLIASEMSRSLREAHGKGVVHRDLKPANVFLVRHDDHDDNESVKVLDFGLVKNIEEGSEQLTKTGAFMGSPKYMAPEQIRDEPVDPRIDVYGLGVVMFEMLTGQVPFDRSSSVNTLMAHLTDPVPAMNVINPKVDVPSALEALVRKCLEKAPDDRYASMNDVLQALQQCAGGSLNVGLSGDYRVGENLSPRPRESGSGPTGPFATEAVTQSTSTAPESVSTAPQAPFAQATKAGAGLAPLFLAAVFALTGIGGFVVLSRPFDTATVATPVVQEAPGASASDRPPAPIPDRPESPRAAPAKKLVVSLRSTPPGATVFVGDKKYGPTPTHVVWTGADAVDGRQVTFRFQRRGYRDLTLTQEVRGDRLDVEAPPMQPLRNAGQPELLR